MIVSEQKPLEELLDKLKVYHKVFLVGCGECATTCKTGGKEQIEEIQKQLEKHGKIVCGTCIPDAPCIAAQVKAALASHMKALREAEVIVVFACGLGTQSVKDNDRVGLTVLPGNNTLFSAVVDAKGNFYEKCSLCAECVLDATAGICPITLCSKGLLNGPCGGTNKGKCETDKDRDCAWVLIYKELEKRQRTNDLRKILPPKDFKKSSKPHKLIVT